MSYNLDKVKQEIYNILENQGVDIRPPVKINNRLTKTLARVCYQPGPYLDIDKVEISQQFLDTSTDESIRQVLLHECCHILVAIETGVVHHHDATFKAMCRRIGCKADRPQTKVERTVSDDKLFKYIVKCKDCDNEMHYNRAGKVVKHPDWYGCGKCGGELEVIQNW